MRKGSKTGGKEGAPKALRVKERSARFGVPAPSKSLRAEPAEAKRARSALKRIQIHIDEALNDAAGAEAARRGISKAALIRQTLARELKISNDQHKDPWQAMTGWLDGGPVEDLDSVIYDRKS